ncbi:type I restriction-modification system subunit M [Sphingobacterium mizutaii NBRC 14946 = DSM 11724]|uniref:site-specific DNA-methyltransferase (adenine-specific) n=2 Tax=Sphingobacterium mizutaii TaxID=1010 RepID=A0AAJ4XB66_9SPHI|nr:type I restriction-modification system subunit M [Sphingobacterium mizutaii]GEM67166.1 type I restriction-modification system subunit M [Sphingobacterium mizutaii NBRC 14946 = DSM 11724]SDK98051.1 type I restriction enzyme M protein [Sphingobacterium mizutaii]SNV49333.1 Probable type I restriction enzyme BthVORF4518P M protein [Sphingobacterium mizutaii]
MSEGQKQQLEQKLWDIANTLRGRINADEYRNYILGFIFFKYLSEKQHIYANTLLQDEVVKEYTDVKDSETLEAIREESLAQLGYYLAPEQLFDVIAKKGGNAFIIEELEATLNYIEQSTMGTDSEEDFNGLFQDVDLASSKLGKTPDKRNEVIVEILGKLNEIDFKLQDIESDVLGDAYEYLISNFAAGAGKSAGEFYTPQQVSTILAKLVSLGKDKLRSVYDPTCGSGSLLLRVARECKVADFYGQELNPTTYNLARMNMILHDLHFSRFNIEQDDTLESPHHLENRFEAIVANPPFSAHWKGDANPLNNQDVRFAQYGKLAPKTKADFAFLQHMYYQLADNGTVASVFPHGVLFRGAAEGVIREYFIKELNAIDAIIGLPANIFYGTSIPTCIVVLKKCRKADDNIVFIDASGEGNYIKDGTQNKLCTEDVERIVSAYANREEIDKYCNIATLAEIAENDYNLNIPRYVDTFEEEEAIDVEAVSVRLQAINSELVDVDEKLAKFCNELNIPTPF